MFKSKSNPNISQEDLKQAELLFFRYGGNKFVMYQNDDLKKYEGYHIPKEIEDQWLEIIFKDYVTEVENYSNSLDLIINISSLVNLGIKESETISLIISILNTKLLDSFTAISICEEMKKIIKSSKSSDNISLIKNEITINHDKLLSAPITIANEHSSLSYMKDYDFSDENIKKRISTLLTHTF